MLCETRTLELDFGGELGEPLAEDALVGLSSALVSTNKQVGKQVSEVSK